MTDMTRTPDERISVVETDVAAIKLDLIDIKLENKETRNEVHEMRNDLARRPPWIVVMVITFLSSACVGLTVALASGL